MSQPCAPSRSAEAWQHCCAWLVLLLLGSGCAQEDIEYREVIRPDEIVHTGEWQAFRRIVDKLPATKLQQFPTFEPPIPQWHQARTLPVDELALEERTLLDRSWDPVRLARELVRHPEFSSLVQDEHLTAEQFTGLAMTLVTAIGRAVLPEDFPLDAIAARGKAAVQHLAQDRRLFASLSLEDRHRVLDEAVWLHYVHEAQMLRAVPEANVSLVKRHEKWLREVLPEKFFAVPLQDAVELLREDGMPFIERPESGLDADIEWSRGEALVGKAADISP